MGDSDQWYAAEQERAGHAAGTGDEGSTRKGGGAIAWVILLIVLLGAALVGFLGYRKYKAMQDRLANADSLRQHDLDALRSQLAAVVAERDRLNQELGEAQGRLRTETAESEQLANQLRGQVGQAEGEVTNQHGRISLNLLDKILFPSGSAKLSPGGERVLDRVSKVLKTVQNKQIIVGGHTDNVPTRPEMFPTNWELSALRAVNVVRYLNEKARINPRMLTASGYSQYHPVSKNLARNRRIEILLVPGEMIVEH